MTRKRDKPKFKPFESRTSNGRFTLITDDMRKSKAYQDLTMTQRQLYFEMKAEYNPEKSTAGSITPANDQNIVFPKKSWFPLYKGNQRKWEVDRDALIKHGFIEQRESGKTTRTPSVYALSERWKTWPEK